MKESHQFALDEPRGRSGREDTSFYPSFGREGQSLSARRRPEHQKVTRLTIPALQGQDVVCARGLLHGRLRIGRKRQAQPKEKKGYFSPFTLLGRENKSEPARWRLALAFALALAAVLIGRLIRVQAQGAIRWKTT